MEIDCQGEWLSSYLDGELDAETAAAAHRHLSACAACRTHLMQLEQVADWAANCLPDVPETLTAAVLAALPGAADADRTAAPYVSAGVAAGIGLALAGTTALILAFPRLSHAWGLIRKFVAILWAAGTAELTPDRVVSTAIALGLVFLLLALAVYGTRLLNRMEETSA